MAGGGGEGARDLDQTPTWAVAVVCAVIILISIFLEKILHRLSQWFTDKHKKALYEALEKVKSELMILGFISLLLTFGQSYITKICITKRVADKMLPCSLEEDDSGESRRRLLWVSAENSSYARRSLAGASTSSCTSGKAPFVSINGLHQLHIFIFFLAIFHVIYSALTMALGKLKIRRWKEWEKETQSIAYTFSNDPTRFRLVHETSFVRLHSSLWDRHPALLYFNAFWLALKKWHQVVRKRHKGGASRSPIVSPGTSPTTSPSSSPVHLLHRYKTIGHSDELQNRCFSDNEREGSEAMRSIRNISYRKNSGTENDGSEMGDEIPSFRHRMVDTGAAELRVHIEEEQRDDEFTFAKPRLDSEETEERSREQQ